MGLKFRVVLKYLGKVPPVDKFVYLFTGTLEGEIKNN
jgi:hypothetical protein